ncbi:MAG: WD40 repeat domain-containing protein [Armatimonadota bacterium]
MRLLPLFCCAIVLLTGQTILCAQKPSLVFPAGHANPIKNLAVSPDGSRLVSGAEGEIIVWDTTTGRRVYAMADNRLGSIGRLVFSPDGARLAASSSQQGILIFEMKTGALQNQLKVPSYNVTHLAFSPDGALLARSDISTIGVWNIATGTEVQWFELKAPQYFGAISFIAPDRLQAVTRNTTANTTQVRRWHPTTGKELTEATPPVIPILSYQMWFTPDGARLFTVEEGTLTLREVATGQVFETQTLPNADLRGAAINRDGRGIAIHYTENEGDQLRVNGLQVWDISARRASFSRPTILRNDPERTGPKPAEFTAVAISPDGNTVYASVGLVVQRWDVRSGKPIEELGAGSQRWNSSTLSWLSDALLLKKTGQGWQRLPFNGKGALEPTPLNEKYRKFFPLPKGKQAVTADAMAGKLLVIDLNNGQTMREMPLPHGFLSDYAITPNGALLAAISVKTEKAADGKNTSTLYVALWEVGNGRLLQEVALPWNGADHLAVSGDGKLLVCLSETAITVWDISARTLPEPRRVALPATTLTMLPCDYAPAKHLAAYGTAEKVYIWDVATGANVRTLPPFQARVQTVVFSPDGAWLAVAQEGNRLAVVDTNTWTQKYDLTNQQSGYGSAITFSPNSKALLVGTSADWRCWNMADGSIHGALIFYQPQEWLAYTAEAKFDASPDVMKRLYWQMNGKIEDLSVHKKEYYTPGLLKTWLQVK